MHHLVLDTSSPVTITGNVGEGADTSSRTQPRGKLTEMRVASVTTALVSLLLTVSAFAQPFQQAASHGKDPIEPDSFSFADGPRSCRVTAAGAALCRRHGSRDWPFRLPTSDGRIDALYFFRHGDDLLIAYELTDGEGGWAQIVRVARGANHAAWRFHVHGLNMATPLVSEDSIFVAALAFVARINVYTGWPDWQLERAYVGGGYEIPEITLSGKHVVVHSRDGSSNKTKSECFEVDTGACTSCGS
jgi:hypothetical protein